VLAPKIYPWPLQHTRWCRNGYSPDITFARSLGYGLNHSLAYRRKVFLNAVSALAGTMGESGSTLTYWRSRMKTGINPGIGLKLTFDLMLGVNRVSEGGVGHDGCAVSIKVTPAGGSTTTKTVYYGSAEGTLDEDDPLNTLTDWHVEFDVSASTVYEVAIEGVDGGRPISVTGIEWCDPEVGDNAGSGAGVYAPPGMPVFMPIEDGLRENLIATLSQMWLEGGAPLINYPGNGAGTAQSVTGTTWTNIFDATTSVSSSSVGFYIGAEGAGDGALTSLLPMCRLKDGDDLPVTFAVYGNASANNGRVRLVDSGGTGISHNGITTTLQWHTSDTTLSNVESFASNKLDLQASHDTGGQTVNVYAVCIYARGA